jgi:antagonist of KipI
VSALVTLAPGLFTTVQDLGRPGHAREGLSAAGAADPLALRIANRLVGNPDAAAGLEMLLVGGSFRFEEPALVALAGADMTPTVDGQPIPVGAPCAIGPGQVLACSAARSGARAYLAVAGGIAVEPFLGSRSTHVPSRLGGLEGRPLRAADRLPIGTSRDHGAPSAHAPVGVSANPQGATWLRITDGAHATLFAAEDRRRLLDSRYVVGESSNRMGLRLVGPALTAPGGEMLTEGMPLGAVQVPPGGEPMILFVDHQTTGGYPALGCVISADLPRVAQLRPRDSVRFKKVSFEAARKLLLEQEAWLDRMLPVCP